MKCVKTMNSFEREFSYIEENKPVDDIKINVYACVSVERNYFNVSLL